MNQTNRNRGMPLVILCVAAVWAWGAGCNGCVVDPGQDGGADSGGNVGQDGGDGGDGGAWDGGRDAGPTVITDAGCVASGTQCSGAVPCCSGNCTGGACQSAIFCDGAGASCTSNVQCCSGACSGGTCGVETCLPSGSTCGADTQCCSGDCTGTCTRGSCGALYDTCTYDTDCCSLNCQGGQCQRAYSCVGPDDICYHDSDCCSTLCTANDGVTGGRCIIPTGAPGCDQSGTPCTSGGGCCTRTCADPGSGVGVCQAVSGCRVAGDNCLADTDCCGGLGTPGGSVDCTAGTNKCDNGQSCRQPGTICGKPIVLLPDGGYGGCAKKPDGTCLIVNNETNCCGGNKVGGVEMTCRLDNSGVPRCFGGGEVSTCPNGYTGEPGCCKAEGEACMFGGQCCGGALCVEDGSGVPRCTFPQCLFTGTLCTPGGSGASACCPGTECLPINELQTACIVPSANPDAGCLANDTACSLASQCCSGTCDQGLCGTRPCQPQGYTCSSSSECCSIPPLVCNVPSGQVQGTCQPSSTGCPQLGQQCSPSNLCCNEGAGEQCQNASGLACDGTTACSCNIIWAKADPGASVP